ncbi:MAG: ABC transporter permease subunit, partial [Planctomycetota bacterium]
IPKILLPTPRQILWQVWASGRELVTATAWTGFAAAIGLGVSIAVGSLLGTLFSLSRWMHRGVYPYVVFLQTIPIVAIAPLIIVWCGYGMQSVVFVSMLLSLFPIVSNVTSGLMRLDANHRDLFRLYGAGWGQRLWRLQFPSAVHALMQGVKVSSGLAVIGAIVGDFFVSTGASGSSSGWDYLGLGTLMMIWVNRAQTDRIFAGLVAGSLLGILFYGIVVLVADGMLRRYTDVDRAAAG